MKKYLTTQEIDNSLNDCVDLINKNISGIQKPHILSIYRGSLSIGVQLSHYLKAPLSVIDFQSYDGDSKEPNLIKNAGVTAEDILIIIDEICDKGVTLKITEEYIRNIFPNNKIIIYTIVGSKEHPPHYNYSIEHKVNPETNEKEWIVFPWEIINDTRCKSCKYSEPCYKNPNSHIHCNIKDKSFPNNNTCDDFEKLCQ